MVQHYKCLYDNLKTFLQSGLILKQMLRVHDTTFLK